MTLQTRPFHKTLDLIWAWTLRTLSGRYQQSALGWFWAIVQPVSAVAIYAVVFTRIIPVNTEGVPYILFSYSAVVPWTLLASSLSDMANSLVQNMNLVGKIYFPREALPIASLMSRLADFAISFALLVILLMVLRLPISPVHLLYLPVILSIQLMLLLGLGIGSSAMNIFYRDVDPLIKLVVQIWFYASPILYPISMVPVKWHWLYFLNPMAGLISSYRDVLIYNRAPGEYLLPAAVVSMAILLAGYWFFKSVEWQFADVV